MIKRHLKNTAGYTLVELLLVITIFFIGIVPVYKMIITGAKVQKVAEETYEATLKSQSLLETVRQQIQKDLEAEYALSRGLPSLGVKEWLRPSVSPLVNDLPVFLDITGKEDLTKWNKKYNTDTFLYELYIWPMYSGRTIENPLIFTTYPLEESLDFTEIELQKSAEKYFSHQEGLLWTNLSQGNQGSGSKLIAVGEVNHQEVHTIKIRANGLEGANISVDKIDGYTKLEQKARLTYEKHRESLATTHELIIEENVPLQTKDTILLSIDLTTFPQKGNPQTIRIENRTKATIVIPVYNENSLENFQVHPVQQNPEGSMVVEKRNKYEPSKNFIIGIVIRDAFNSTFGSKEKILTKLIDIYSYDYNRQ